MKQKISKNNSTIIIIAYNRPKSLELLLSSLKKADYNNYLNLIISIDGGRSSSNNEVLSIAQNFKWDFGVKQVIYHSKNLGLRKHILSSGSLSFEIGDIIMLEDDLYLSPCFYKYAIQALDFYRNDEKIAGISLYSQKYNETARKPFEPVNDGNDVYFMQLASSWGQAWTKNQWDNFYQWYNEKKFLEKDKNNIPKNIRNWPKTSWKKYFNKYLIETGKYFVYPYVSLTTNMREKGVHAKENSNILQVPFYICNFKKYKFSNLANSISVYDSFHENTKLKSYIKNIRENKLIVDIYGTKEEGNNEKYLLTTKIINKEIINSYGLKMKPHDLNVIENIRGKDIFLYDMSRYSCFKSDKKFNIIYRNIKYYFFDNNLGIKRLLKYLLFTIFRLFYK